MMTMINQSSIFKFFNKYGNRDIRDGILKGEFIEIAGEHER